MTLFKGQYGDFVLEIKHWNNAVYFVQENLKKRNPSLSSLPKFRGSVDDLASPDCGECGSELIRQFKSSNGPFQVGVVYCSKGAYSKEHTQEYWVEVWLHGNAGGPAPFHKSYEEKVADAFVHSNPLIGKSFDGNTIFWNQHMFLGGNPEENDYGLTFSEHPITPALPRPDYVHSETPIRNL